MNQQKLWLRLLELSKAIVSKEQPFNFVYIGETSIVFDKIPTTQNSSAFIVSLDTEIPVAKIPVFHLNDFNQVNNIQRGSYTPSQIRFLELYLSYCFLPLKARQEKRCISIAHFAQTLDGKIATHNGDAYWIGNEENLDHAHRMRALCDGIIVGTNTVKRDRPKLTVRRVKGNHPQRIILGSSVVDLASLTKCCADTILMIGNKGSYSNASVQHLAIPTDNCMVAPMDILKTLFEQGIYSVYIEGGAVTTSNFIKANAIDILQLHIAPILFGSGKQGISLPVIENVGNAVHFSQSDYFKIGDAMMFVGRL